MGYDLVNHRIVRRRPNMLRERGDVDRYVTKGQGLAARFRALNNAIKNACIKNGESAKKR